MKFQVAVGFVAAGALKIAARSEEPAQEVAAKPKLLVGLADDPARATYDPVNLADFRTSFGQGLSSHPQVVRR